jgi:hypothetical protein
MIPCGESFSIDLWVPAILARSARILSWRRAARRRVPLDPLARGELTPRFAW